jgi:hypothetical protein
VYLNVQLDPLRRRTTSTHEAAVRSGQTLHLFSMIFMRADSGEVESLVSDGADAIVRVDNRRPAGPEEGGPDVLLDAKDAPHLAKYLRVWWKEGEEINTESRVPGQWSQASEAESPGSRSQDGRASSNGGLGGPRGMPS